jgi:hypothetical protein
MSHIMVGSTGYWVTESQGYVIGAIKHDKEFGFGMIKLHTRAPERTEAEKKPVWFLTDAITVVSE